MQRPEPCDSSIASEVESHDGQSRNNSLVSMKQRSGSTLNFLAEDFQPTIQDVVCGRGKKCYSHAGNELFKSRVEKVLDEYSRAKTKLDKSAVLNRVVADVRRASPGGGFVKQDDSGRWYEVGDFLAREKTSQAFRDALHERYKSSNVSKKKRRKEVMKFSDRSQMMQTYSETDRRPRIELSTGIFSQNYAMDSQQSLLPFPRSLQLTNQSNSSITPAFTVPGSFHSSSALPPLGPSPAESHTLNAFGNRSFSVSDQLLAGASSFVGNQRPFQLMFEGDSSSNFNSLPDMRYDMNASTTAFRDQMHHSLPNMHFNYNPEANQSIFAAPTQYDMQLQAIRHSTLNQARFERQPVQQHSSQAFALEFEPEFGSQPPQVNSGAPLLSAQPIDVASRPSKRVSSRKSKKTSPDDQELLQCLDKLTEYKLSDDPYEPVPLGGGRQGSS